MTETRPISSWTQGEQGWSEEVRFIIAMLAGHDPHWQEGRCRRRYPYRVKAVLELEDPSGISQAVPIYTRDVNAAGLGFIVRQGLPTPIKARLIRTGRAIDRSIDGTIIRCRPFIEGWFEGAILFDVEQAAFEPGE